MRTYINILLFCLFTLFLTSCSDDFYKHKKRKKKPRSTSTSTNQTVKDKNPSKTQETIALDDKKKIKKSLDMLCKRAETRIQYLFLKDELKTASYEQHREIKEVQAVLRDEILALTKQVKALEADMTQSEKDIANSQFDEKKKWDNPELTSLDVSPLTTLGGDTYEEYELTEVAPDGITISYDTGIKVISFGNLSEEIRKQCNYNPIAALYYRIEQNKQAKEKALLEQERQQQLAAENAARAEELRQAREEQAKNEKPEVVEKKKEDVIPPFKSPFGKHKSNKSKKNNKGKSKKGNKGGKKKKKK